MGINKTLRQEVFLATRDLQYVDVSELQAPAAISTYTIGPFQATNGERAKVKVKACLNLHGIVYVDSAQDIDTDVVERQGTWQHSRLLQVGYLSDHWRMNADVTRHRDSVV
ncbi:heat shock protein 70 family [Artemisia annua]|uniref:Heat shock protein 70 family n=1 Tax=Artemisia annua TaxID=35608 RepID=A0A2U1L6E5_ARTAN|nr:heat shock protein 70 family [Artemisia annua]